ncbi:MAG: bifunctional [glutamate--ammonia ligase]-adenylyl-L-tyrosine phosphorylase/[glutamate--ammonia-ligase] adenylyltransferase [Pseudomonadales bacterium]|nr:bifunctional [glutamate--ammonia ligase]-adenylyl-L-tyrosine phosphorylase/[glutamate--ammonia-ligase] adenylyltransferase [Pseudomonadales bacterium]MCP5344529.1 bifunctional [glutamate--ammonia ligase]-adenylyl-L-tyrosine phosphorylase/[glutamate--ammonia-ligase] adenylyltransferase [Pseudomonadales bacterium]
MLDIKNYPDAIADILQRYWQRLVETESGQDDSPEQSLVARVRSDAEFAAQLARVWSASDYVAELCVRQPMIPLTLHREGELARSHKQDYAAQLRERVADIAGLPEAEQDAALKERLREYQQAQMLRIIWRDVCGLAEIVELCAEISALADAQLDVALEVLHAQAVAQWGTPIGHRSGSEQRMIVIGMGKLGAHELNLSSDIDLMFVYPEAGETRREQGEPQTNQQFFTRLGQRLIDALDTVTAHGFVFRVDMRLRPYGSEGALVCSFDAMETYYQSQGRDWERYALIKGRAVAGDIARGRELLAQLRPFVYRRYLDFSAFEALRSMKMQINKQVRRKGLSQDIKLGAGGIREVEFIVQALQLVHGGRDKRLQEPSLYKAMKVLADNDYLPAATVHELVEAYGFLRALEHKLQGLANKQTQMLVSAELDRQRVALAMNFPDWLALIAQLDEHRRRVSLHFAEVIRSEDEDKPEEICAEDTEWGTLWRQEMTQSNAEDFLARHHFENPQGTAKRLDDFRRERTFVTLQGESRQRFDRFMPVLLQAVARVDTPSLAFERVMTLISAVSRRTAYLVLMLENRSVLSEVVKLCTASPFVTDFLSKHPVLLDELLGGIDEPPVKAVLQEELAQQMLRLDPENFEEQMETLRYFKQSHTLQVAAAQITGRLTVMKVSDYLTFTAEAVLEQVLALSWAFLTRKHGYPVNIQGGHGDMDFLVLGFGKLGGIELSYISDLDLVFLHHGALDEETVVVEGQRAINSREFYTRLAQRVIMMLGTYTVSGKLYEVDMRLRPSGESGLLVSSVEAFESYERQEAWTWEHQALVRARAVAGSPALQTEFDELRASILGAPRDLATLAGEVTAMRQRMRDEFARKPAAEREKLSFVIKHSRGGIVDIEFMVQYLVLAHGRECPALLTWSDNVRILEAAHAHGLLSDDELGLLHDAYLALRSALHDFALAQLEEAELPEALVQRQAQVARVWDRLFADVTSG